MKELGLLSGLLISNFWPFSFQCPQINLYHYLFHTKHLTVPVTQKESKALPGSLASGTTTVEGNDVNDSSHLKYETGQWRKYFHFYYLPGHLVHGGCSARVPIQPNRTIFKGNTPFVTVLSLFLIPDRPPSSFHHIPLVAFTLQRFSSFPVCYGPTVDHEQRQENKKAILIPHERQKCYLLSPSLEAVKARVYYDYRGNV